MNAISVVTRDINEFLKHPLVIWAESFFDAENKLSYEQLINSTCFHAIIRSIDPRSQNSRLPNEATDTISRLVNLDFILRSIRSFVQDVLRYIIVAKLPNIYVIAHEPYAEYSFDEIERLLLLLFACSVSGGDRKDIHIQHLTRLNESIQQSLMPHIEELTNEINTILQPQEYFFNDYFNTDNNKQLKCLFINLMNLLNERDHYFEEILELEQDKQTLKQQLELYQSSSSNLLNIGCGSNSNGGGTNLHSTPSQTSLNTFLNDLETKNPGIEITEYKTKMRQMKSDLDDKMDTIETMREEFELLQTELNRVKSENIELSQSTRLTRLYRDEIDTLNEKLGKMEKYQQEIERYKERFHDFDTLKNRFEELQNENQLLAQARSHLEQQIEEYRYRINEMLQSETEIKKFKHDIETITHERDMIQEKLSNLLEDKVRLELDLHSTTHTVDSLSNELHHVKSRQDFDESRSLSISFQIQQTIKNRLLKYDIDNKQLSDQLTALKERYDIDMHMKRIDEEKQNIHIQLLNEQINEYLNNVKCLEIKNDQLAKEKLALQNQLQDNKIDFEKTRSELEANNKHLKLTLNSIQQREQMETTAKFQDIEQENKRFQDRIGELMQQISQLQIEHDHLTIVKERECSLNERIINLQLKYDQLAREHLTVEKRCEMYEKNLKHYETLEHNYLELKHNNECYSRQIAHVNQLEKEFIDKNLQYEQLEKENIDLKKQIKQLNECLLNEEETNRQLKNDYLLIKQRYNEEQFEQLTKKLNDACDLTRQIQIKLKRKQDETDHLKKTLSNNETMIEKLRNDLRQEAQLREELQQRCHTDTSQEINDSEEKKKNYEMADMQLRLDLALKSDKVHASIQRSLKETIETLNHHIQDLQSDKSRLQSDLQQATLRIETLQTENLKQRQVNEQLENDRMMSLNSCQHFQQTNDQLINDHDQLQKLYTKLENEFDTTINQLTDQRTTNRMLTKECKYLQIELDTIVKEKQNLLNRISYLLKQLHQYESKLADQKPLDEQYVLLQQQYQSRTDDLQDTMNMNQNLKQQLDETKLELSKSRSDLATIQMKYTSINAEYTNLIMRYEFLEQQTERAEEEKSQLIEQLHNLVLQNQNVLTQALSNKDLFHEEARGYLEQLHSLMRQKELLEMKIMEQYKNMPIHKPRRSRGLIQSVSRKTRHILDRLANRRQRTSSADGQLYLGDSIERAMSPSLSSVDNNGTPLSHARSTTPDVISSSLTSARQYQTPISDLLKKKQQETNQHHQSTDSLADSSSKEEEDPTRAIDESAAMAKSSTPIRATLPSKATEFILNNHRQSPFRPIRDSPGLQHSLHDVSSPTVNQRRCSSTQSFLVHPNQNINQNIHSSMRRHRLRPSIISSPLSLQQQPLPEQQQPPPQQQQQQPTSFNDHVLITEFGAI
ncbi:unnamed protein product [Rotaria socialis]|uniref:Girdin n=3 Tax=Rotaria socialis TaxID=392032 RepID=A0A818XEB7_9BILA|nr:unnamed protein product [Rotaria socialis]CAF3432344.1 unnamed protein product [Rotaria socialis]CAF3438183.1 unnamed protein product [Rotaria socialis]CAF3739208.1 unnamed protein product [Rotaria socialis]CAF4358719.1 unnamed protein product [Rotaria socialis]